MIFPLLSFCTGKSSHGKVIDFSYQHSPPQRMERKQSPVFVCVSSCVTAVEHRVEYITEVRYFQLSPE